MGEYKTIQKFNRIPVIKPMISCTQRGCLYHYTTSVDSWYGFYRVYVQLFWLMLDALRLPLYIPCAGRRSTWGVDVTCQLEGLHLPTWRPVPVGDWHTDRDRLACCASGWSRWTAAWFKLTWRTWNRPLRMDSWPVVVRHWTHTKGAPAGPLFAHQQGRPLAYPAWVPSWLGYIELPASAVSESLCESRLRLPHIGMHVHTNHKTAIRRHCKKEKNESCGQGCWLKTFAKKKLEEPIFLWGHGRHANEVLFPITGEAGRVLLSTVFYYCVLTDFYFWQSFPHLDIAICHINWSRILVNEKTSTTLEEM